MSDFDYYQSETGYPKLLLIPVAQYDQDRKAYVPVGYEFVPACVSLQWFDELFPLAHWDD